MIARQVCCALTVMLGSMGGALAQSSPANTVPVNVEIQRLISAATTWGGNPRNDAIYLNFTPPQNDGNTLYKLNIKDVPVDGFWSISREDQASSKCRNGIRSARRRFVMR